MIMNMGARRYRARLVVASWLVISAISVRAGAADIVSNEQLFQQGVEALSQDNFDRSIEVFETLSDRGFDHPDAAYNRGLAYLGRVRTKQERAGDLGRAAAAFEDAMIARRSDKNAAHALELVRTEVSRRIGRSKLDFTEQKPSFDRIIVNIASETVWAWLALAASIVLTVGLLLRPSKSAPLRLTGMIQTPIGLVALVIFAALTIRAHQLRVSYVPAVVVVTQARIIDENGTALPGETPIPEATRVEIVKRQSGRAMVRYGQRVCWTHASSLRTLIQL